MISGAHVVMNSTDSAADRAFFRDVPGYKHVDAGHSWLIFARRWRKRRFTRLKPTAATPFI